MSVLKTLEDHTLSCQLAVSVVFLHSPCENCASNATANDRCEAGDEPELCKMGTRYRTVLLGFDNWRLETSQSGICLQSKLVYTSRNICHQTLNRRLHFASLEIFNLASEDPKCPQYAQWDTQTWGYLRGAGGGRPKRRRHGQRRARPHLAYDGKPSLEYEL